MIIADRKQRWKALCAQDQEVLYWQQIQEQFKSEHGANCEVDALVAENDDVDLRKYLRGKRRRETLLKDAKLAREGSTFVPLEGDEEDSNPGDHSPGTTTQVAASSHGQPVGNEQAMSLLMTLLGNVAAMQQTQQASLSAAASSNGGGSGASDRPGIHENKDGQKAPGKPGPPQGGPTKTGT
jgi:hypothetical protein